MKLWRYRRRLININKIDEQDIHNNNDYHHDKKITMSVKGGMECWFCFLWQGVVLDDIRI